MDSEQFLKKHKVSAGDRVEIESKEKKSVGTIIPSISNSINLKFDNGYNAGFAELNELKIKKISSGKKSTEKSKINLSSNKGLPKILVMHTGGTIASKVDYSLGGVIASYEPEDLIKLIPEITEIAQVETKKVSNIMSEDMTFSYYTKISKAVFDESKNYSGIIIGHGTDTLAYTSAALSFALQGLNIPVLIVGSQRSTDRPSTDAAENLLNAAYFISKTDFCGVGICMHENINDGNALILPGTKTRKMHTSRRDAFKAINDLPIARVNYAEKKIGYLKKDYSKKSSSNKLELKNKFGEKVAILKIRPNMYPEEFDFYRKNKFNGLVLEGTAFGHAPTNIKENLPNYEALKKLIKSGTIVVMATQCIYGRTSSQVYTNLRRLKEIGIIFSDDMLSETAYIKLAWLLGNYSKKAKEMLLENIAGEFNARISKEFAPE
ncbi:MAG: Glu-tRNA(Gln) amidotransferase subunit GatD [Candidatus Diapherotrites archaeon]